MGTKRNTARHAFTDGGKAHEKARHMARYSGKNWIAWHSKDDTRHYAQVLCAESIKAALLDIGTQGHFYNYANSPRWCSVESWPVGLLFLRNIKHGYPHPGSV